MKKMFLSLLILLVVIIVILSYICYLNSNIWICFVSSIATIIAIFKFMDGYFDK